MNWDFAEIRNWISFTFLIVGGSIAIRTFVTNQNQRRLENSFKLIDLCRGSLSDGDFQGWHMIFVASSELSGAKHGHFVDEHKQQIPFSQLFSEGEFLAQGAIERFCEVFNLIGYEYLKGAVDIRLLYFEFGQYLESVQYWVAAVDENSKFFKSHYPYFYEMFEKNKKKFGRLPHKTIAHIE